MDVAAAHTAIDSHLAIMSPTGTMTSGTAHDEPAVTLANVGKTNSALEAPGSMETLLSDSGVVDDIVDKLEKWIK